MAAPVLLVLVLCLSAVAGRPNEDLVGILSKDLFGNFLNARRTEQSGSKFLWPDGNVKVFYEKDFPKEASAYVDFIAEYISNRTCLRFVDADPEDISNGNALEIRKEFGQTLCDADVPNRILTINLENCRHGKIIKNFLLILGFPREQNRADRDQYVTIQWDNVGEKDPFEVSNFVPDFPYDFSSILHDGAFFETKNEKQTIKVKKVPAGLSPDQVEKYLGQERRLSQVDVAKINKVFNCSTENLRQSVDFAGLRQFLVKKEPHLDVSLSPVRIFETKEDVDFGKYLADDFAKSFRDRTDVNLTQLFLEFLREKIAAYLPKMTAEEFAERPKGLSSVTRYREYLNETHYRLHFPSGENWH